MTALLIKLTVFVSDSIKYGLSWYIKEKEFVLFKEKVRILLPSLLTFIKQVIILPLYGEIIDWQDKV